MEEGTSIISGEALAGESYSSCGPVSYQLSQSHFSSADVGTKEVEVTIKDIRKKSTSCKGQVKVLPSLGTISTYNEKGGKGPYFEYCDTKAAKSKAFFKQEDHTFQVMTGGEGEKDNTTIIGQYRLGDGEIKVRLSTLCNKFTCILKPSFAPIFRCVLAFLAMAKRLRRASSRDKIRWFKIHLNLIHSVLSTVEHKFFSILSSVFW